MPLRPSNHNVAMDVMTASKKCQKCLCVKPASEFNRNPRQCDGLHNWCKVCSREYCRAYHAARKKPRMCAVCGETKPLEMFRHVKNRKGVFDCLKCEETALRCARCMVLKNPDEFAPDKKQKTGRKSFCRACDASHQKVLRKTDEYRKKRRAYRQQPGVKQRELAYNHAYFATENGREKIRKYANSPKGHLARARRREREVEAESTLTAVDWEEILLVHGNACAYCHRSFGPALRPTIDHKKALARGGSGAKENIVPACLRCNHSKGAGDWPKTMPDGTLAPQENA